MQTAMCVSATSNVAIPTNFLKFKENEIGAFARSVFPKAGPKQDVFVRLLLSWRRAAYHDRCGTRWLVKTADEFLDGLAWCKRTVYRALQAFEDMGLIVKRQAPHPYAYGPGKDHCNWIALKFSGIAGWGPEHDESDCGSPSSMFVTAGHLHTSIYSHCSALTSAKAVGETPTSSVEITGQKETPVARPPKPAAQIVFAKRIFALACTDGIPKRGGDAASKTSGAAPGAKLGIDAILAARKERPPKEIDPDRPLKTLEAFALFQRARKDAWPNEPAPPQTKSDLALMKQVMAKARALKFTEPQIATMITTIVMRWDDFRELVKSNSGRKLPERPQVIAYTWQFDQVQIFMDTMAVVKNDGAAKAAAKPITLGKSLQK